MNKALGVFLLSATLASVAFVMELDFGSAQASTEVKGILTQDTVWGKQGSPYVFAGSVGVAKGVTLMVEAGVTVNIGSYYLEVNGTLNVKGTTTEKVVITSDENPTNGLFIGWIEAYSLASGHNNIVVAYGNPTVNIQNAELKDTSLFGQGSYSEATVTITDSTLLNSAVNVWGQTTITNSYAIGPIRVRGTSILTDNTFLQGIELRSGNFEVSRNNISKKDGAAVMAWGSGIISGNIIWGSDYGITQEDKTTLSATIERNLIKDNTCAIYLRDNSDDGIIKDNTFTQNTIGISNPTHQLTITGNSFIDNTQYDIKAGADAVSAKENWWGTTDRAAIAEVIYDSNDDFSLGTIVYQPILTQASINAPDPNMCPSQSTITPAPTDVISIKYLTGGQTNTSLNNIEVGLTATVIILSIIIVTLVVKAHKSRH